MSVLDSFSLRGKVALVTGGAGLYGRQIADAAAQSGARTYIASRRAGEPGKAGPEKEGPQITPLSLDLADEGSILALRDEIMRREGRIDVLVNNAVARTMKSWNDDLSRFAESMDINATGLFAITRAFGDVMAEAGEGSIINIASMQGMVGPDRSLYEGLGWDSLIPDYFFHKGGMINFTKFVAAYYGPKGVRCNCVSPGGFRTESHDDVFLKRYGERTMLGRMANSTDLMGVIVFLASEASAYVTGANIPVDGGYTAK